MVNDTAVIIDLKVLSGVTLGAYRTVETFVLIFRAVGYKPYNDYDIQPI